MPLRRILFALFAVAASTRMARNADAAEKPNVVYIMADDMGYPNSLCL